MRSGKILLGVLAGVAVGALAGILFAPEKGAKTRKQILKKGEDYTEELKEKFEELLGSITKKYEGTRQEAEEIFTQGKTKFEDAKKGSHNGTS